MNERMNRRTNEPGNSKSALVLLFFRSLVLPFLRSAVRAFSLIVVVLVCAQLAGCKREEEPKLAKFGEKLSADLSGDEQATHAKTPFPDATACEKCGELAAENHDCRFTRYCSICRRDIGEGHICGGTVLCTICFAEKGRQHECLVTSFCNVCRTDVAANHLCERSTRKCFTSFCPGCKADVAYDHICGLTFFCPRCRREVAENHVCDLTRLCPKCRVEIARGILCGRCAKVLSTAMGPERGVELFCPDCGARLTAASERSGTAAEDDATNARDAGAAVEYLWGAIVDCAACGAKGKLPAVKCGFCGEICPPVVHQCGVTHFCTKCKKEAPLDGHKH